MVDYGQKTVHQKVVVLVDLPAKPNNLTKDSEFTRKITRQILAIGLKE